MMMMMMIVRRRRRRRRRRLIQWNHTQLRLHKMERDATGNVCEKKKLLGTVAQYYRRTENNQVYLSQYCWSPSPDLKPRHPKYEAATLHIPPQYIRHTTITRWLLLLPGEQLSGKDLSPGEFNGSSSSIFVRWRQPQRCWRISYLPLYSSSRKS